VAASTPEIEEFNRILLIVHGVETDVSVTLPQHDGVVRYRSLWSSAADDVTGDDGAVFAPGDVVDVCATSMWLFRAESD
jgi:glycogen operon protein